MGFSTVVHISNDAWHVMEDNPKDFTRAISRGMNADCIDSYIIANYANYLKVAPSHHADEPRLYLSWRNSLREMSRYGVERDFPGGRISESNSLRQIIKDEIGQAQAQLNSLKQMLKVIEG